MGIQDEDESENISVINENESAQLKETLTETEDAEEKDAILFEKENTERIKITQPLPSIVQVSADATSNCNDKTEEGNSTLSHEDKLVAGLNKKESTDIFPEGYPELLTT